MKKRILLAALLASFLVVGSASAQMDHEATHGAMPGAEQGAAPMAPGMMMGGMKGGPGMKHGKMGGHGDMMGGMGMCNSMGGGGMGGGMMGPGMGNMSPEAQQKFLDATKELRKKLHGMQFEYGEAARNPKADKKELLKKRKELWEVQQKIHEKAWDFMTE